MWRNVARIGVLVTIVTVAFDVLDLKDKVPPLILWALGTVAVSFALWDYFSMHFGSDEQPAEVKQSQADRRGSANLQADQDIKYNEGLGAGGH